MLILEIWRFWFNFLGIVWEKMCGWRLNTCVFETQNHSECSTFYADQFHIQNKGYSFDFMSTHAISTPVKSIFSRFFGCYFFPRRAALLRLVSKDVKFSCASFGLCLKFVARCARTQTPTQNLKLNFRFSHPRKLVRVWYHFKFFFKRYNMSYSDSSFIPWGQKS